MTTATTEQPRKATAAAIELDNVSKVFPGGTRALEGAVPVASE